MTQKFAMTSPRLLIAAALAVTMLSLTAPSATAGSFKRALGGGLLGAGIGAIVGGGKGAAIGGAIGAGVGLLTK